VKFTPELLKRRLVDRMESTVAEPLLSRRPYGSKYFAAAEVPAALANDATGVSDAHAGQYTETVPPAAEWAVALAAVTENLRSLASSMDHLSRRCDFMIRSFRQWQRDLHVDLVHQRMKSTEIGAALVDRIAAVESLSGKLDTLGREMAARYDAAQLTLGRPVLTGRDLLITKVDDFILAVPRTDWILAAYYVFWGTLERGVTQYLEAALRPGMVFVDVGANIGIHTLHAARAVGSAGMVHSFEPSPETFRALDANVRANGFERIALYPMAVLDRSGEARLHEVSGMCGWNSLFAPAGSTRSVPVKATTLDEALMHAGRIDIVKIDAEGAEPFIWHGMRRILEENPGIRIVIEFAPAHLARAGVRAEDFLTEIFSAGFAISRIGDESGDLTPFDPSMLAPTAGVNLLLERPAA
jgi:FkbM family methyltransferase